MRAPVIQSLPLVPALLLGALNLPAGGAEVPPAVAKAFEHYIALPDALVPVLREVQSAESAEAAAPKLRALLTQVLDVRREIEGIQKFDPGVEEEVHRRYEMPMRQGWGRVYDEVYRLQKVRCYENVAFFKQFQTLCMFLSQ